MEFTPSKQTLMLGCDHLQMAIAMSILLSMLTIWPLLPKILLNSAEPFNKSKISSSRVMDHLNTTLDAATSETQMVLWFLIPEDMLPRPLNPVRDCLMRNSRSQDLLLKLEIIQNWTPQTFRLSMRLPITKLAMDNSNGSFPL